MICVVEAEPTPSIFQLLRCKALQRSLSRYRHENGEMDKPMRKMEGRSASFCDLRFASEVRRCVHQNGLQSTSPTVRISMQRASASAPWLSGNVDELMAYYGVDSKKVAGVE